MSTLLRIDSSAKGSKSVTRAITNYFVEQWRKANPQSKVVERD